MDSKVTIKGNGLEFEATGEGVVKQAEMFVGLLRDTLIGAAPKPIIPQTVEPITHAEQVARGVEYDVVAIYDNVGIPSIMHRFRRMTNRELFGGSDEVHPAFKVGGKILDEIFISVYENCKINGRPYSLPFQEAWTDIANDEFAEACFSKGEGWHMMTGAEWGLLALLSYKNGTLPHGNTMRGKYHADLEESGEVYADQFTLTGSGPNTWTHDHTATGVHDLCGNHREMVRGVRLKDGKLQAVRDNDAAVGIELSEDSSHWEDVLDNDGNSIYIHAFRGNLPRIVIDTNPHAPDGHREDYAGICWKDVEINCESDQLKALALFPGEGEAFLWVDTTEGEWFLIRGGSWYNGADAGVFDSSLGSARSISAASLGGRSAFFRVD